MSKAVGPPPGTPPAGAAGSGEERHPGLSIAGPAVAVLLAATSGAADALAFFGLGGAFGGIVTGNLVTAGYGAPGRCPRTRPARAGGCGAGRPEHLGTSHPPDHDLLHRDAHQDHQRGGNRLTH
jgi:hypothetical protein